MKKTLFKILSKNELIAKAPKSIPWKWDGKRNQLSYLAKHLKAKRKLGNNCHEELVVYIEDPKPNTKKPLKNINEIAGSGDKLIKAIVEEFIKKTS